MTLTKRLAAVLTFVCCIYRGVCQFECPGSGFYADSAQCDKYYICRGGEAQERMCPDGLVFRISTPLYERCDYPFNVVCDKRTKLQPPQPNGKCPRQVGLFPDPDRCDIFYECRDGKSSVQHCNDKLSFNPRTGRCQWTDQVPECRDRPNKKQQQPSEDDYDDN